MATSPATLESDLTYLQIKSWLSARVGSQWAPGTRLPPIRTLARQLRAGQRNTYRAVQELVAEGLLISAPKRGTYVAHAKRVHMPLGECEGMTERMAQAFITELRRRGIAVERGPDPLSLDLTGVEADATALIHRERVDQFKVRPGQMVTVISTYDVAPRMMDGRFDIVSVDQFHGASLAGRLLRDAGVGSACFIGTGNPSRGEYFALDAQRLAGFEEGIGFPIGPEHRLFARLYDDTAGAEAVARYLELSPRPRGVFTVCDDIALGFLMGAAAHGLVAGRDFDLVGFDGQWRARHLKSGALTTVAVPCDEMGRLGAELLASRLENPDVPPRTVHLGCTLFRGNTVGMSKNSNP